MTDYVVIAHCGRSLAASAHRAAYRVHVIDCFADEDTKLVSNSTHQVDFLDDAFDESVLLDKVSTLGSCLSDMVLVLGAGFEKRTELIDKLADIAPVLSNSKSTIDTLKDPGSLYNLLSKASITTPDISSTRPTAIKDWLIKQSAATGGAHVQWASQVKADPVPDSYYQKYISGTTSSAVFLAMKTHAKIVGYNEQLQSDQFAEMPFLYKGVISRLSVENKEKQRIEEIVNKITSQTRLLGLCGIDYIVDDTGEIYVLEINPRPPSSFDLYEQQVSLFDLHIGCFEGRKIDYKYRQADTAKGYVIFYAKHEVRIDETIVWPSWVKDKPCFATVIKAKYPVCSIHAEADSIVKVKADLENKLNHIETMLMAQQHAA
jgi:predicted ATP-grasp superfamily ATP-dependent carboligase